MLRSQAGDSREESAKPSLLVVNLIILILCVSAVAVLYFFTAFDPTGSVVSVGVFLCAMILASAVAFALSKSFETFPILFKVVLIIGFLLIMYSSWVMAVIEIASSDFLSPFVVGIAFILGQFLIHISPIVGTKAK
jgi:uncharacterized membrane protein